MAETCLIRIRDLPSRALRKRVRGFLAGDNVSIEDDTGKVFAVAVSKNRIVLRCDDEFSAPGYYGKGEPASMF
ncbi:MAG: hypothetical protein JSW61_09525 [Candidatus Thorarchaeota archaeon]|nr:MAG: hypothetical protein JSW61_09525 [Candidatus Thorarchaeota archaeon]